MGWIDTHCHLNDDRYNEDIELIMDKAKQAGVTQMIVIGYDLPSSEKAVEISHKYDNVFAAVGIHPSDANKLDVYTFEKLAKLVNDDKVVAIGEIGLDYYWEDNPDHEIQKQAFIKQLQLAESVNKPVVIHMRDATKDTFDILKHSKPTGVMHCYSGSYEMAQEFIKLGLYISLAGPVTFKNAVAPKEVATKIPLDYLLIETDCPYLTPHPFRGKRNDPSLVTYVAKEIATLRNMSEEDLKTALERNTKRLFNV